MQAIIEEIRKAKKTFEEGPINLENGLKLKEILKEFLAGDLDFVSVYWILHDKELGGSLLEDIQSICRVCGVIPNILPKGDGDTEFEIWLTHEFCLQTKNHQKILDDLIAGAQSEKKGCFQFMAENGYHMYFEANSKPAVVMLQYNTYFDLVDDMMRAAGYILFNTEPEEFI